MNADKPRAGFGRANTLNINPHLESDMTNTLILGTAALKATTPLASRIDTAKAVFGKQPSDVVFELDTAAEALGWLEALCFAMKTMSQSDLPGYVERLAEVGISIAEDAIASASQASTEMTASIEAAAAQEGGAA